VVNSYLICSTGAAPAPAQQPIQQTPVDTPAAPATNIFSTSFAATHNTEKFHLLKKQLGLINEAGRAGEIMMMRDSS